MNYWTKDQGHLTLTFVSSDYLRKGVDFEEPAEGLVGKVKGSSSLDVGHESGFEIPFGVLLWSIEWRISKAKGTRVTLSDTQDFKLLRSDGVVPEELPRSKRLILNVTERTRDLVQFLHPGHC